MLKWFELQFIASFIQSILYGIYLVTFVACVVSRLGTFQSHPTHVRPLAAWGHPWVINVVIVVLFVISTLNVILNPFRAFGPPPLKPGVYALPRDRLSNIRDASTLLEILTADSAFIYRCWIVYFRSWPIVAPPIVLWIGICFSGVAFLSLQISSEIIDSVAHTYARRMLIVIWSLTIALNIYVTTLIVVRIWLVDKRSSAFRAESASAIHLRLRFIARIVIESALLYTCSSIFVFVALLAHRKIASIAVAINTQILGIAFNVILIRLSWAATKAQSQDAPQNTTTSIDVE